MVASEEAVEQHGLTPRAVIRDSEWSALGPLIMGLAHPETASQPNLGFCCAYEARRATIVDSFYPHGRGFPPLEFRLATRTEHRSYIGLDRPVLVIIDPNATELDDQRLRLLHQRWHEAAASGNMPRLSELLDARMASLRDYLMALKVIDAGGDFRYLTYGQAIAAATGSDLTGQSTSDLPAARSVAMGDVYATVLSARVPVFVQMFPPAKDGIERWDRLAVPVQRRGSADIDTLLVVAIPFRTGGQAI